MTKALKSYVLMNAAVNIIEWSLMLYAVQFDIIGAQRIVVAWFTFLMIQLVGLNFALNILMSGVLPGRDPSEMIAQKHIDWARSRFYELCKISTLGQLAFFIWHGWIWTSFAVSAMFMFGQFFEQSVLRYGNILESEADG